MLSGVLARAAWFVTGRHQRETPLSIQLLWTNLVPLLATALVLQFLPIKQSSLPSFKDAPGMLSFLATSVSSEVLSTLALRFGTAGSTVMVRKVLDIFLGFGMQVLIFGKQFCVGKCNIFSHIL